MSMVTTDNKNYSNIASKIREKAGTDAKYKPSEMPSGIDAVHKAGKQAEYDRFWDLYQNYGNRTNYNSAFGGRGWTEKTFLPKHPIIVSGNGACAYMFSMTSFRDFKKHIQENGIVIDLSQATGQAVNLFGNSSFLTHVPEINLANCNNFQYGFTNCGNLVTVDKLTVSSAMTFSSSFANCSKLENITFEGEIGKSIDFKVCPLTLASAQSVITHLANYAGTATEGKNSVSFSSATIALLNEAGVIFDGLTWEDYLLSVGWSY